MSERTHSVVALILLFTVSAVALAGSMILSLLAAPARPDAPVLVLTMPWGMSVEEIVKQSGGRLIGPEIAAFGALAIFPEAIPEADLTKRGSWLLVDGNRIAEFCGVTGRV